MTENQNNRLPGCRVMSKEEVWNLIAEVNAACGQDQDKYMDMLTNIAGAAGANIIIGLCPGRKELYMEMNDEKTLRILGKRGRVTIPQEVRDAIGMARGDVVSFAVVSEDCALVKRERICDNCSTEPPQMIKLLVQAMHHAESSPQSQRAFEFLTSLSPAQQLDCAAKIIAEWAEKNHEE